jgi:hypothetical protein
MKAIFGEALEAALNDPVAKKMLREKLLANQPRTKDEARTEDEVVTVTVGGKRKSFKLGEVVTVRR